MNNAKTYVLKSEQLKSLSPNSHQQKNRNSFSNNGIKITMLACKCRTERGRDCNKISLAFTNYNTHLSID